MTQKIALNGLGQIGRMVLRSAFGGVAPAYLPQGAVKLVYSDVWIMSILTTCQLLSL